MTDDVRMQVAREANRLAVRAYYHRHAADVQAGKSLRDVTHEETSRWLAQWEGAKDDGKTGGKRKAVALAGKGVGGKGEGEVKGKDNSQGACSSAAHYRGGYS